MLGLCGAVGCGVKLGARPLFCRLLSTEAATERRLPQETVYGFMMAVWDKLGVPLDDAKLITEVLRDSDLRGIRSHGVGRLKYYCDRIKSGRVQPVTKVEVVQNHGATALLDGHHGMGHVVAKTAMDMAISKAKEFGVGAVSCRNSTHFGIAGYWTKLAAAQGCFALTTTNARPIMAPTFSVQPRLGTNPIAFSAPSDAGFDYTFDAATTISQRGKVEVADRQHKDMPPGLVIDDHMEPETDPHQMLEDFAAGRASMLPLGGVGEDYAGYKGYGLATMVEMLSAGLADGAFMDDLSGFDADGNPVPYRVGHFFLAIDAAHFVPEAVARNTIGRMMTTLQESKHPTAPRVYVAGEKEWEHTQRMLKDNIGVPVNDALLGELRTMKEELGIEGFDLEA